MEGVVLLVFTILDLVLLLFSIVYMDCVLGEVEMKNSRHKRNIVVTETIIDNIHQSSNNSTSKETWESLAGLETNNDYQLLTSDPLSTMTSKLRFIKNYSGLKLSAD